MFREEMEKELTEKDGQLQELISRHKDVSIYILNKKNIKLYLTLVSKSVLNLDCMHIPRN